jgi:hypothetical protein
MQPTTHESFAREDKVAVGSERSFGIVMAVFFALIASLNLGMKVMSGRGSAALPPCSWP